MAVFYSFKLCTELLIINNNDPSIHIEGNVLETFHAMIGGMFAPLTIKNNEDSDTDSKFTTFDTAVTETAIEILGKHRQKKKPWVTAEILDLSDKRRETRNKGI